MFGGGYKGTKLRVNLRLAINRLKLLQKKKSKLRPCKWRYPARFLVNLF